MEEKKTVVYLDEVLSENDVFAQTVTINYDDKLIIYSRGVEKTEIIDGEVFVGKKPNFPYVVNEIDKKTKKRRVYVTKLIGEEDLDDAMFCMISEMYGEIKTDGHPDGASLRLA